MPKVHFSKLAHNLCCCSVWRTCRMWWRCSSQVWMKIRISSKYTTTNELVNGRKMSSINLMKVAGAFVNPKGITSHSKKAFLGFEGSLTHIRGFDWYLVIPRLQVDLAEIFFPFELVQKIINPWDRVPIPDNDLFQCPIINTESPSPILLLYQHNWAPKW